MDRRDFFKGSVVGLGALAVPACAKAQGSAGQRTPSLGANPSWADVRAQFKLTRERIHMTGFLLASHPRPVADAIERHRAGFDDDPATYLDENEASAEMAVRRAAAKYVGGDVDDLAMTDSTTQGVGVVYGGLRLQPGQELLTTTHDHLVTHLALEYRATRTQNPVRKVSLYDDPPSATTDEIVARLTKAITPATRVIAVTWVHSGTGVKLPIKALADAVARANASRAEADRALLFVDGVHGFGNQDVRVAELGCDFFMAGCHKWIFGPRGTGLVWARRGAWSITSPIIPSFDRAWRPEPLDQQPAAGFMTPGGFHSFEHRWALPEAFAFHEQIGVPRVAARIRELNTRCKEQLAKVKGVKVATPMSPDLSAGIICFSVHGKAPADVVKALGAKKIVASVTPPFYNPPYVRLAPSLLTDESDVDRAVAAVATV
jgi:selenocysteine lyase/cysteine desulfurase